MSRWAATIVRPPMLSWTAPMRGSCRSVQTSWASIRWAVGSSTASGSPESETCATPEVIGTERPCVVPGGK